MGICTKRHFLLSICVLQLLSTIERQIFDFLGFMWAPILANFFEIIFVIFGFFGAFQYRPKYIITYCVWNLLWIAWNAFIICFYLDVGILSKKSDLLNFGTGSFSWWLENGIGCKPIPLLNNYTEAFPNRPIRPEKVDNCLLDYTYVEVLHACVQCILAIMGVTGGIFLSKAFLEEDDTSAHSMTRKPSKRTSLYSIEFSSQHEVRQPDDDDGLDYETMVRLPPPVSPKPMTPRRVKRRSVMTRGSSGRHSTNSRRHHTNNRSSRRLAQNPVTRLIEQQQKIHGYPDNNSTEPNLETNSPMYYNTSVSNSNLLNASVPCWQTNGHTNPTYQQSSSQSLNDQDDFDDLYNNRPPSVRSSYSNFHGTRPISYHSGQYYANQATATPQVPLKRTNNGYRQSLRSMTFFNNGPPAYTLQGHGQLDSETTI